VLVASVLGDVRMSDRSLWEVSAMN
jgi:hypothetical protein